MAQANLGIRWVQAHFWPPNPTSELGIEFALADEKGAPSAVPYAEFPPSWGCPPPLSIHSGGRHTGLSFCKGTIFCHLLGGPFFFGGGVHTYTGHMSPALLGRLPRWPSSHGRHHWAAVLFLGQQYDGLTRCALLRVALQGWRAHAERRTPFDSTTVF